MDLERGSITVDAGGVVCGLPRHDSSIPIDGDAERVVRKLIRYGHEAYLVGGCVRDLWLKRTPKDFDVATSATPQEIRGLFRNCRIIGRRFQLAHIFFGPKIIETSTFRKNPRSDGTNGDNLLIRRDNVFGNDREDAQRRDFTINGLFYNVQTDEIIDYVGGLKDLEARLVRTIGDPNIRFREDPVRMLRAIKFAARLGFEIEEETYEAIREHRGELSLCAPSRVLEEFYRLLRSGAARRSMELLLDTGMARVLWSSLPAMLAGRGQSRDEDPGVPRSIDNEEASWYREWGIEPVSVPKRTSQALVWEVLDQLDAMVARGHEPSNSVLVAALVSPHVDEHQSEPAWHQSEAVADNWLQSLSKELRIARRDMERVQHVLAAQRRLALARQRPGRLSALVNRDYFGDALTVYELMCRATGEDVSEVIQWRSLYGREEQEDDGDSWGRRRRRRRGGRRRRRGDEQIDMHGD